MKLVKGLIISDEDENLIMNKDTFYEMDNNFNITLKENKQLKEKLEDKIDLYEGDTISYQLGYDSAKALYEKILTELEEYMKDNEGMYILNAINKLQELKEKYK